MNWRTKSVRSLRISFINQKNEHSNKKLYSRKVAGFASTMRNRGVLKNTGIELSNDLKNELKDIRVRIDECIRKDKLEVKGMPRKTTSQSPNEVIDHMIERNGNKLQELESLSLNTLQGFYKNTRVFHQNKPKVDMNTSKTDSYHFHKFTQLLPSKIKVFEDDNNQNKRIVNRCGSIESETKYHSPLKRKLIDQSHNDTPDFVNNLLFLMKTTYPSLQNEFNQIKIPENIHELKSEAERVISKSYRRKIKRAHPIAITSQGIKTNEGATTNSDHVLSPKLTETKDEKSSDMQSSKILIQNPYIE